MVNQSDDEGTRIRELAREQWDDEWYLHMYEDADGDRQYRAYHTVDIISDGIVIRDVGWMEDGELTVERWLIDEKEVIAEIATP